MPTPATQISRMPAMKNNDAHTSATSMVWPKSGCATKMPTTAASNITANVVAGMSVLRNVSANSHEIKTTNDGLRNSDG